MTNFRNLKIAINDQQPLDEVVKELERLRYKKWFDLKNKSKIVIAFDHGLYDCVNKMTELIEPLKYKLTTLSELKEM